MARHELPCPYKRKARCDYSTNVVSELTSHVKSQHSRNAVKLPKANKGMAHCIWPGCGFEHEKPGKVIDHVVKAHSD